LGLVLYKIYTILSQTFTLDYI